MCAAGAESNHMKMKELCPDERPREKMMAKGAASLSNAELVAILMRTGTEGMNVLEVSQAVLKKADGSLTRISAMSIDELCRIGGIGPGKAVVIGAAMELGKRLCSESPSGSRQPIRSSADVYRELSQFMRGLQHEECWILYLSRNNRILSRERLSIGGQSETIVEVKSVVRRALDIRASSVIISHNHPSGDPHPGSADIQLTRNLKEALGTFSIPLLDHVIISDSRYYSFSDECSTDAV